MIFETNQIADFKERLRELEREELLQIIEQQNPDYIKDIKRIEWVFKNKLGHLSDNQGQPIEERDLTQEELINLIDPPFVFSSDMMKQGFNEDSQKQIHIASDPVLWCKQILGAQPRAYQTLVMREKNDQVVLRWGRRLGKAVDVETVIPTLDGYKRMADIQVGDKVFDENGEPCNVTDVTEFQHDRKCYTVTFVDGSEIVADAEHVWSVHDATDRNAIGLGQPRPLQNLTTEQMSKSVYHYGANSKERNYSIPLTGQVKFSEKDLPLHPWVYGYLVANGYEDENCVRVIAKDHEAITGQFNKFGYELENVMGNKFRVNGINKEDFNINTIDSLYLTGSIEQRKDLLRGLCDARASLASDYIEISLPHKDFVKQILMVVTSLGYECRQTEKVNKKNGKYYGTNHKILWFNDPECFLLHRKKQDPDERRRKTPIRIIASIEETESRPVKCIAVDSRSRLYLASESHIPTHNSFFLSMYIIWYAFVFEKARILVMAPTKAQVTLIYEQVLELADNSSIVVNSITKKPRSPHLEIWFKNKSSIKFFTTGMRSGQKCLSPDHDVLTKDRGWVPIADVEVDEKVASWKNGNLIWGTAAAKYSYKYEGKMINHKSRGYSFMATPNHKWKVVSRGKSSTRSVNGSYWLDSTELINKETLIPATGTAMEWESDIYSPEELELWGWWLSEGSGFDCNMARFSQQIEVGRERIIYLAKKLNLHHSIFEKEIRIRWKPPIFSGTNAYDKFIPRELILEKNNQSLLEGLIYGDGGYRNEGWRYSSSSKKLIDDIQELAVLKGYRVNIGKQKVNYKPVDGSPTKPHWYLSAYPYKNWNTRVKEDELIDYNGTVHCITVPETGTFLARRSGSGGVFVTGNSDGARGQEADMIVLDEMDYMGADDLVALMAMLQNTDPNKAFSKKLIGASTPTGQRSTYWRWNTDPNEKFASYYFPSYVNPLWNQTEEEKAHRHYRNEQNYRHEIEADWGEDADGVYPRKYVDMSFDNDLQPYQFYRPNPNNYIYTLGVDWDKHGAGVNIAIAQCEMNQSATRPIDIVYREEIQKGDFTYIEAVDYIIKLNTQYDFEHIYIDQGAGEVQAEMLHKYGLENPYTRLHHKVKACHFSNIVEVRDPYTRQINKKRLKPFMVDNLVYQLEQRNVRFQPDDDELYLQLISYIKIRETESGNPVYAPGGETVDHAHDALILSLFAVAENYDELFSTGEPQAARPVSGNFFMPSEKEVRSKPAESTGSKPTSDKILTARTASIKSKRGSRNQIKRSSF